MKSCFSLLFAAVLAIGALGCNANSSLGTIRGKVTSDGAPVMEATISFRNAKTGESVSDVLDAEGAFEIAAAGGVTPGQYKVVIIPPEVEVSLGPNTSPALQPKEMPNLPQRYRSMNSTPLTAEVSAGPNEVSFELTK